MKNIISTFNEFSIEFVILFCLLSISLFLVYILAHYVIPEKKNIIDNAAFLIFRPFISARLTLFARVVTFFGTGSFLIPSYALIVYYLIKKNYVKYAMMVSTMVLSSLFLGWLLKPLFHRSRPLNPLISGAGGYSFPSGHALGGFIFSGILLFLIWKTKKSYLHKWMLSLIATAFGTGIGLSRIYLHVHFATDVIGSLFVTIAWFSLSYIFFRILYKHEMHERKEIADPGEDLFKGNYHFYN